MNQRWSKIALAFMLVVVGVLISSSAMAINVNTRSEEMVANSLCDKAGSITFRFNENDYNLITDHLTRNNYVLIRITLNGTDIALDSQLPKLCKTIEGGVAANGARGVALPNSGKLVHLGYTGGVDALKLAEEVSDHLAPAGTPDVEAFVYGYGSSDYAAAKQYFEIFITGITPAVNWTDENQWPWIRVGLYLPDKNINTAICANVKDFSRFSKLTISPEMIPNTLTYTSADDKIGHFIVGAVDVTEYNCGIGKNASNTKTINLCPNTTQDQACPIYGYGFKATGDLPSTDLINVMVRTNGATNNATDQDGVYFSSITVTNVNGTNVLKNAVQYFRADGTTAAANGNCGYQAKHAKVVIDATLIGATKELRFCVNYEVDPKTAKAGTKARFWTEAQMLPCGALFNKQLDAADLVACSAAMKTTLVYPYFTAMKDKADAYLDGIAILNMGDTDGTATLTVYETDGDVGTFTTPVIKAHSQYVNLLSGVTFTKTAGAGTLGDARCYIVVCNNFKADGFAMIYKPDGESMGYLPRGTSVSGDSLAGLCP